MPTIATFPAALNAILAQPGPDGRSRHVQVIAVALVEGVEADSTVTPHYLVVDGEGRGRLLPADAVKIVDDSVLPPKYA